MQKFENKEMCPICWEGTEEGIKTSCLHYFHQNCLFNWFENQDWGTLNCPVCRKEF